MGKQHVLVVGAGPVGVIASLACAQRDFQVTLVEAAARIDDSPRAATTHSSTLEMIDSVGLVEQFTREGLVARYFDFWDQPSRKQVARFDHDLLRDETKFPYVVQTEQHKLARMGIEKLKTYADVRVSFETALQTLTQTGSGVTAEVACNGETETITADYVIAADGGRSTVRKLLGIAFEGMTWPERFVVITVLDDLEALLGCSYRNYLAAPRDWGNLFKVAGDDGKGRWRIVYPSSGEGSDDEDLADAPVFERLQRVYPLEGGYNIVHRNIYRVHQRVAATFRQGRVFLAGDSAHVNNPIGGLGLNSGIHDAMEVADMLSRVSRGIEDAAVFDRYDRRRRALNIEFVQQQTIANKKRLEERDEKARQEALDELRATVDDPVRHKQFLMRSSLLDSVRKSRAIQ
jgi:3-(3-hydroxy-phenyl)propionate hydroxylase